ncbi:hypothetical protein K440DRAFT_660712 [Wilcoxina mikolae CBS 423.85]|nr:hypothetical protein K440DRAFT_660712 [Wilcoxina mikolae CBS 423.85]
MLSPFLGVYTAKFSYTAQTDKELSFDEGDLFCILNQPADDDWWKVKKKGNSINDEEPVGLVPNNYIEEAKPIGKCKALYDYTQQTEEELSLNEDALVDVYDSSDSDWSLVGLNGRYGYAPSNYIQKVEESEGAVVATAGPAESVLIAAAAKKHVAFLEKQESSTIKSPSPIRRTPPPSELLAVSSYIPECSKLEVSHLSHNAASLPLADAASLSKTHSSTFNGEQIRDHERPTTNCDNKSPKSSQFIDSDDSDGPGLPLRRLGEPPYRVGRDSGGASSQSIPPRFRTYAVLEVDAKKKRAATLGLGPYRIILLPDKSTRPREEWSIDNMTGYNHEGKHVFLDVKHPIRSLDLHAGSTHAAEEIVSVLGELRGIRKAAGLDEVIAAANEGKKNDIGTVLYDFPAQGEDEVSVTAGDEVIILDDSNCEWWLVRRQVNGAEGVLPSSYVERGRKPRPSVSGIQESPATGLDVRTTTNTPSNNARGDIGVSKVPERRSSLAQPSQGRKYAAAKLKPDTSQIRTWTDRTGSFKVEAQFLGCKDGKIHLHKINGVKIAVPVSKMSMTDLKYVEDKTGISLDEDKPLSEILKEQKKNNPQLVVVVDRKANSAHIGASVTSTAFSSARQNSYDWFDFFLSCGIEVNNCQRYATNFQRDEMDESSLEGIDPGVMRTLGMKEGDILRVLKKLDDSYGGRVDNKKYSHDEVDGNGGKSLFTDESGNLKSSRTRPPPAIQTGAVDPKAFKAPEAHFPDSRSAPPSDKHSSSSGVNDETWAPKLSKPQSPELQPSHQQLQQEVAQPQLKAQSAPAKQSPLQTASLGDIALSLNALPPQPMLKSPVPYIPIPMRPPPHTQINNYQPQPPQRPGMIDGDFSSATQIPSVSASTLVGIDQPAGSYQSGRIRPPAPVITGILGIAPHPTRPLSAPETFAVGPLQTTIPTFTGNLNTMTYASMPPLDSQKPRPAMTGTPSPGISQHILYQPGRYTTTGNLPNGGVSQQQGHQAIQTQQREAMLHSPSLSPFQVFAKEPNIGSLVVNRTLSPPLIPQPTVSMVQPQPTGPAPQVRFGMAQAKLQQQTTGKADLNKAMLSCSIDIFFVSVVYDTLDATPSERDLLCAKLSAVKVLVHRVYNEPDLLANRAHSIFGRARAIHDSDVISVLGMRQTRPVTQNYISKQIGCYL